MNFAAIRRWIVLALLVIFVAYFGVWELYLTLLPSIGKVWATVTAALASIGLGVIAFTGMIMVRTRSLLEVAEAKRNKSKPLDDRKLS